MYTIGEFAKLGHVSPRMLRHYDKLGLLAPAIVNESNGYRYYDQSQLAVLQQIQLLSGFGFALRDIKPLLLLPEQELAERIHTRRLQAYHELNQLRQSLRQMENMVMNMEGTNMKKYQIIVMQTPAQRVFGLRKRINVAQTHQLFQELAEEMQKRKLKRAGVTQLLYHGQDFSYEDMDVEAQVEVSGEDSQIQEIPSRTCIATTHIGPYETLRNAYYALGAWMKEHPEYQIAGPAIERYLKDENEVESPEELETGVLFPVSQR